MFKYLKVDDNVSELLTQKKFFFEVIRDTMAQLMIVNVKVVGLIPTRRNELLNIYISSPVTRLR